MSNVLLTAAAAAIILAVVGGGATAFGVEVPVLASRKRQVALALVGVGFFAAAVVLRDSGDGADTSKDVLSYRQQVLATCRSLRAASSGLPPLNPDLTIDRTAFLEWARGQLATSEDVLDGLWSRPVPDELKEQRAGAERDARDLADRTSSGLDELEDTLPTRFPFLQGRPAALQQFSNELAAPSTRFEASMSELAAEPCRPSPTETGGG